MPLVRERRESVANLGTAINLSFVSSDVTAVVYLLNLTPGRVRFRHEIDFPQPSPRLKFSLSYSRFRLSGQLGAR